MFWGNMEKMTPIYSPGDLRRLKQKRTVSAALCWCLGIGGFAVCVALCALANTRNAQKMEFLCIAVWVLAGWVVLYLRRFAVQETRLELQHAKMLLAGEPEAVCGRVRVTKERLRIIKSIRITMVELENEQGKRRLKVCTSREKTLKAAGEELTLYLVSGYIAGYGPAGEGPVPPVNAAEQNRGN